MSYTTNKYYIPDIVEHKFIPIKISVDISEIPEHKKKIIKVLIEAAKLVEELYLFQKNPEIHPIINEFITRGENSVVSFIKIMGGIKDHFNEDAMFIDGSTDYKYGSFYPSDITMDEWDNFYKLNSDKSDLLTSPHTVLIRSGSSLEIVDYSVYYKEYLTKISKLLSDASELADNYSLKSYLSSQAASFLNNDFDDADIRWLQLDGNTIEPLIGAHEYYDDKFLGYKASFTAFVSIRRDAEHQKMLIIRKHIDLLQNTLPIPDHYKKFKRGSISQIAICDLIYSAGDGRVPIHTAAFNLPNSQKIRSEFGSKKVLLYNIMEHKFRSILLLIGERVLSNNDFDRLTYSAYFNLILLHEISHELGVGFVKDEDGELHEISFYLKDLYTIIEEAKADVMSIYGLVFFIKQGLIIDCSFTDAVTTYITGIVRSLRFGDDNAHSKANLIQWNILIKDGVILLDSDTGRLTFNLHRFEKSIEKLLVKILTLQGEGNYDVTEKFIKQNSGNDTLLDCFIKDIEDVPVDIIPYFDNAGETSPFE